MTHLKTQHISDAMRECIESCSDCHDVCTETLIHCLETSGELAAPEHVGALLDCAQACDASRDFMLRGSDMNMQLRAVCAQACDRCADSCERLGADHDDVLRNCAQACRRCAKSCRSMAG
jgi:Domain of Unknown Function (DUF326)